MKHLHPLKKVALAAATLFTLLALAGTATAATEETAVTDTTDQKQQKDTYPLTTCPISGGKLGSMGAPAVRQYDGREVRFCCAGCFDNFEADLKASLEKVDQMIVAAQKPGYPLDTCLVSGEKLGEMGPSTDHVHDNQLVRFCCDSCVAKFEKETGAYMKKLHAAYAAAKSDESAPDTDGSSHSQKHDEDPQPSGSEEHGEHH